MNILNKIKKNRLLKNNLYGKKLIKIIYIHDYVQLYFDDGSILNLYNKIKIVDDIDLIIGKTIEKVKLNNKKLQLIFADSLVIEMSMKDEDYIGQEAFEYNSGSLLIIG